MSGRPDETKMHQGLWNACASMEFAALANLSPKLNGFAVAYQKCYEAGTFAPTIATTKVAGPDLHLAALFLKRTLNDLRAVWLLASIGYTSQAASVAAALFEHALAVEALAGSEERAAEFAAVASGDLPWSPTRLSKIHADLLRTDSIAQGKPFSTDDWEMAWREVYGAYKFLCKIKHPTLRSTVHDAPSTTVASGTYVVMAAPDLRPEDLPVKATVLMIAFSRTYAAISRFILCSNADKTAPEHAELLRRMKEARIGAVSAYDGVLSSPLPFDIADESIAAEYADHWSRLQARRGTPPQQGPPGQAPGSSNRG